MFRAVVGHRRVLSLLSRAIAGDTLPPALLFSGPEGVGKRRTASALSRAINCLAPVAGARVPPLHEGDEALTLARDACGECAACRRIERDVHPDVIVIAVAVGIDPDRLKHGAGVGIAAGGTQIP